MIQTQPGRPRQSIAVDWSGARDGYRRRIWRAVVRDGQPRMLACGLDRAAVLAEIRGLIDEEPASVVGLDFAFSFPQWFLKEKGCASVGAFWDLVAQEGERWLRDRPPPFGWRGAWRALPFGHHSRLRRTDEEAAGPGGRPESVFKLAGASQVGPGSVRGIPLVRALRAQGCAVWPFDAARLPLVVEIYPRVLYGALDKRKPAEREAYLRRAFPDLPGPWYVAARQSDDAFDAAVSALEMARHADGFLGLAALGEPYSFEGKIWAPETAAGGVRSRGRPASSLDVPEISRFFGIVIRMFVEPAVPHHRPHFHATFAEHSAVYAFEPVERLAGDLPRSQERLVLAWAEIHRLELAANWRALQAGRPASRIEPLR